MPSQYLVFKLAISSDAYLAVYEGRAKVISTFASDGRRVEFAADNVRKFLTHDGIFGVFEMEITAENKFVAIKRIS